MDDVDALILSELLRSGRMTMYELGEAVGLSSSAVHRRVKALEQHNVITGYQAVVDRAALGRNFEVYVSVMLDRTEPTAVAAFEAAIDQMSSVVSCHRMFGEPDYLLLVAVADVNAYEQLWATELSALPGCARVSSQMTMKVVRR